MPMKPLILVERDGPLATLTLNHPEKRNAMNTQMTREAESAIDELAGADDLRVLIIEGAGSVFSAGADVVEMGALTEESARDFISNLHSLIRSVREFPHPVVCKCRGYVLGGALELMLGCDLRGRDGRYEVRHARGAGRACPPSSRPALFVPFCGLGAAQDLLLTGRTFDAQEAHRLGIVQRICPQSDLEENDARSRIRDSPSRPKRAQRPESAS